MLRRITILAFLLPLAVHADDECAKRVSLLVIPAPGVGPRIFSGEELRRTPSLERARRPIGNGFANESEGHAALDALARGNRNALANLNVALPAGFHPDRIEWALARNASTGRLELFAGAETEVPFLPGGFIILAHTHPSPNHRNLPAQTAFQRGEPVELRRGIMESDINRNYGFMPSLDDILYWGSQNVPGRHRIYPGFRVLPDGRIARPDPTAAGPRIFIEFFGVHRGPDFMGRETYRFTATIRSTDGTLLWKEPMEYRVSNRFTGDPGRFDYALYVLERR